MLIKTKRNHTSPLAQLDRLAGLRLLAVLKADAYQFVTPTPATHERVLRRRGQARGTTVRDVLGWSLPFSRGALPAPIFDALEAAGAIVESPDGLRSTVRVSSLGQDLFIHSAFPPEEEDAVFFGPDTYRFARFLRERLEAGPAVGHLVDIGSGSGAGAVVAARAARARRAIATDITPAALAIARINMEAAGVDADLRLGSGLEAAPEIADLIIANPPFIADDGGRIYRDGGGMHGAGLSLDWAISGAERLAPGGRMLLYTGAAIVDGQDALRLALQDRLDPERFILDYQELDPDIFGEQLAAEAYQDVERIAAVGAVIRRRA